MIIFLLNKSIQFLINFRIIFIIVLSHRIEHNIWFAFIDNIILQTDLVPYFQNVTILTLLIAIFLWPHGIIRRITIPLLNLIGSKETMDISTTATMSFSVIFLTFWWFLLKDLIIYLIIWLISWYYDGHINLIDCS